MRKRQIFEIWKLWTIMPGTTFLAIIITLSGCARRSNIQAQTVIVPKSIEEVARLDKAVNTLYDKAKYQEAIPLAERSLMLREKTLEPRHPDVAISLTNLAHLYQVRGEYARAEPLFVRALDIREKALGSIHPDVAQSLNNLGKLYLILSTYARADPLLTRALEIREKALGPMHPDVAESLNDLGELYIEEGLFARAKPLLTRALEIREKALGPMHPDVAQTLNNLAGFYAGEEGSARAEPLLTRALEIREKALGAMHPDVAESLHNLAEYYSEQNAYARAEPLYIRALDILEKALGSTHPYVAYSLDGLAVNYEKQGAYTRAEPLLLRAHDIREKTLGPMHPEVTASLDNLASFYLLKGAYAQAEPLLLRALDISENILGAMHPRVARILNRLASLYFQQGAYARAEPLYVRVLDIYEKAKGPTHTFTAGGLEALANLYQAQGAYARAEPLYVRVLDIREKTQGAMHPAVATSLANLANLYQAQGAYARAEPLLARAAEIREASLRAELAPLSESRKRDLILLLQGETERLVSLQAHAMPTSLQALELALTTVLRRKGRALDSVADAQATLRDHLTPELHDKLAQLADASTQLSTRLRAPFDPKTAENQKAEIASLRTRIDELEAELNQASVEFRVQTEPVTISKIQAALPQGTALVELVRYRRFDARQVAPQDPWKEAHYLAYLLLDHGSPRWVELGAAARIDAAVDDVLAAMRKDASASAAKAALRHLDALVFAPIRGRLAGVSHIIVSPDGKLNLVPFEALIDPQGRYAVEQRLMSYVTSGRDLLRLAARRPSRSSATIVADPDYGPPGTPYVRVDGTLAEPFPRLAGTRVEADQIREYFPDSRTLAEGQATKVALLGIVSPSVLHVATHGFYTQGGTVPAPAAAPPRLAQRERGMSVDGIAPPPPPSSEDPIDALDHAGLALAGANVGTDGIVSARELARRDWWGTQLVVLSACGTGVGAVPSGEGVYGVRRALVLAGAQAQVVSLWSVNDSLAPELMREFYAELARGTGRAEALRRAKLHILQQPRFAHPYYWAPFILAGDWTPLEKGTMRSSVRVSEP